MRYIVKLIIDTQADNEDEAVRQAKRIAAEEDGFDVEVEEVQIERT